MRSLLKWASTALLASQAVGIDVNVDDQDSIKSATSIIAKNMMNYYTGYQPGDTPGNLPDPYYWWEAGAMFMNLVEYWFYTGDTTYNEKTTQAISHQAGPKGGESFVPSNQSKTEGNDDQIFWAFAAMQAAEYNYPAPTENAPSWAAMAQSVFNGQASRWDDNCGGGLRWQMFGWNNGYNYKNIAANGGFFLLTSQLARYTRNHTFIEWAEKEWNWFSGSVLFEKDSFQVNDGTDIGKDCSVANDQQWSYNYGFYVAGLAYLYNQTEDAKWMPPLKGLVDRTFKEFFATRQIIVETACEPIGNCDTNGFTFKGYTMRWLAVTAQLVPELADQIWPYIKASGTAAGGQCSGGDDGSTCGMKWTQTTWDGSKGVGQQMSALSAIGSNMLRIADLKPPYTRDTGGKSEGDPNAGTDAGTPDDRPAVYTDPVTGGDKAGAGILTALVLAFTLGGSYWMVVG
ncbi:hypothetical protein WHR41_01217 [Cladosporium halotolerans]|uniref:Mannan endo-1,6-alpha-mannosidase n=1 Tax=Cladosporium halotolerans TaxID=1052096 RepID=A0AB34KZ54_9PEZI